MRPSSSPPHLARRPFGALALLLALAACDATLPWTETASADQATHDVLVPTPASLTIRAWLKGPAPAPQAVTFAGLPSDVRFSADLDGDAGIDFIGGSGSSITLQPKAPDALGTGTFTGTLTVRAFRQVDQWSELPGSPWTVPVSYVVGPPALEDVVTPIDFQQVVGGPPPPAQTVVLQGAADAGPWTATVSAGAEGWLQVTPSGSSLLAPLEVQVVGAATYLGYEAATVTVTRAGQAVQFRVDRLGHTPGLSSPSGPVALSTVVDQASPPAFAIPVETEGGMATQVHVSVSYGQGPTGGFPDSWLGYPGILNVPGSVPFQVQPSGLDPGRYEATITISNSGSPTSIHIPVSLDVTAPAASLAPSTLTFRIDQASTPDALGADLVVTAAAGLVSWTADADVPWLSVTPSGSASPGAPATLRVTVVPAALEGLRCKSGSGHATVRAVPVAGGVELGFSVPVSVEILLPCQELLGPGQDVAGVAAEVVIVGWGLDPAPQVLFGDVPAASVRAIHPGHLRAVPPPLPPGEYRVTIPTSLGAVLGSSTYRVVAASPPPAGAIAAAGRKARLVYDDGAGLLWAVNVGAGALERLDAANAWSRQALAVPDLVDAAPLRDAGRFALLAGGVVSYVDTRIWPDPLPTAVHSVGSNIVSIDAPLDGHVILAWDDPSCRPSCSTRDLDPVTGSLSSGLQGDRTGLARSGARLGLGNRLYGWLRYWDASSGVVGGGVTVYGSWWGWSDADGIKPDHVALDRHGDATLLVRDGTVSSGDSVLLGRDGQVMPGKLPATVANALLTQAGDRAIAFDGVSRTVRVFDLTSAPDLATGLFVELGTPGGLDPGGEPGAGVVMALSADDRTLFLGGDDRILVVPLP